MKITVSLSSQPDVKSWITDKIKAQNVWKSKASSYRSLINRLLQLGGDFVFIPEKGDPLSNLLSKSARKFTAKIEKVNKGNSESKKLIVTYNKKDPERYRVCIGYALIQAPGQAIAFWNKHYWLFDRKTRNILEFSSTENKVYFGISLSKEGGSRIINTLGNK